LSRARTPGAERSSAAPPPRYPRGAFALVGAAWVAFGCVAGLVEYVSHGRGAGIGLARAAAGPLLAGLIWIPLTWGIMALVRRRPPWPLRASTLALHGAGAAAASFVLNGLFFAAAAGLGLVESAGPAVADAALRASVRFAPLNAAAYVAIAAISALTLRLLAREAGGEAVAVPGGGQGGEAPGSASGPDGPAYDGAATAGAYPETLPVRVGSEIRVVAVHEVDWIEGAGDYARLHVGDESLLAGERLKTLERRLDPTRFARIHRSTIVNLGRVAALRHRSHGDYDLELEDGTRLRVSRNRRASIRRLLA